jgi:peptide deformylase
VGRKSRAKAHARSQSGLKSGALTVTCPARRDEEHCAPLNHVLIWDGPTNSAEGYAACECGRRFSLSGSARKRLVSYVAGQLRIQSGSGTINGTVLDDLLKSTWPRGHVSRFSKPGVVPIGTPVLHSPTNQITVLTEELSKFGSYLVSVMQEAEGIGLAANQVGVSVRALAHKFGGIAPRILINPEVLSSDGAWDYVEGCLSLKMEGTSISLRRPKTVVIRATTIRGKEIVLRADEVFARVLQHEIDHLDGIEYVQRLVGGDQVKIYKVIEDYGIDLSWIPPKPYT